MIRIGGYLIDAAISEEESLAAEVTEYPVESGAVITDHTRNRPRTLELEFVVSDTPIGEAAAAREAGVVPSSEARQKLEALRATRQPFTVVTGTRSYEAMIFTSLSFPRDGETGDVLRGKATLQQLTIVEVRRVSVQLKPNLGRRAARTAAGKKLWLCSAGIQTAPDDATNKNNGCREVVSRDGALVFVDTGAPLTDLQVETLNARLTLQDSGLADNETRLIPTATKGLFWDPVSRRYVDKRQGVTISKVPTTATVFEAMSGIPSDYTPPDPPKPTPSLGNTRETGTRI